MRTEQGRRDEVTLFKLKQKTFVLMMQLGKKVKLLSLKLNPPLAFLELFSLKAVPKWEITSDMGQCQGAQRRAEKRRNEFRRKMRQDGCSLGL